jgi:two-component system sensor histidine kinase UhpB
MAAGLPSVLGLRQRLLRLPIFDRVLLGNSLVIVVGAVGGTLVTRHLAVEEEVWLIALFAVLGILLSLLVNYWILRSALRPLRDLRLMVDGVQAGQVSTDMDAIRDADPDTQRLAAAIQSMRSRLEEHSLQLRALSERAINAQEDERKRIARGLHDDTGQALTTVIFNLERLEGALPTEAARLRPRLAATRELAARTLDDLRKLVYGLRPTMLDDLGLVPAIRWYARSNLEEAGIEVAFIDLDETIRLAPRLETALFRITQEAINNILRHAGAHRVEICLFREVEAVCLRVEDDGRGFDIARIWQEAVPQRRLGLLGMQERVELVGGQMTVESAPGRGTRIEVQVPISRMGDVQRER